MKLKHTPGPWKFDDVECAYGRDIDYAGDKRIWVGSTWRAEGSSPTSEECEANARLIAAAPEMLDALIQHVKDNRLDKEINKHIFVILIERATGMSIDEVLKGE